MSDSSAKKSPGGLASTVARDEDAFYCYYEKDEFLMVGVQYCGGTMVTGQLGWRCTLAVWHWVPQCDTEWHSVTLSDTVWHSVTHCDTEWHSVRQCDKHSFENVFAKLFTWPTLLDISLTLSVIYVHRFDHDWLSFDQSIGNNCVWVSDQ